MTNDEATSFTYVNFSLNLWKTLRQKFGFKPFENINSKLEWIVHDEIFPQIDHTIRKVAQKQK